MKLNETLAQLGFNQNKAKTYLACLELGTAPASQIAKEAGIVRTTVYKILEELNKNDLIETEHKNNQKTFIAKTPNKLIELLEENKKRAEDALPDFLNIFKASNLKPKMKFYEGQDGARKVFEDGLSAINKIIYSFAPAEPFITRFGQTYTRHYMEKRVAVNIFKKSLRQTSDQSSINKNWEFHSSDKKILREVKFLPSNINFNTLIQVYDQKTSFVSCKKESFAFIMESAELSSFMKQIFNFLWSISQE